MTNLPHMYLIKKAHDEGVYTGRSLECEEICQYIEKFYPSLIWFASALRHQEHKDITSDA